MPLDREAEIKLPTESLCERCRASHRLSSYPQADFASADDVTVCRGSLSIALGVL